MTNKTVKAMETVFPTNIPDTNTPKVINVIVSKETRGLGVEGNVYRKVKQIFTLDGELICEYDPSPSDYELHND